MKKVLSAALAALMLGGWGIDTAAADDPVLAEIYGQGVHAYFAGDYSSAHALFSSAIQQGSGDPRCYLFRGLVYSMLGRPDEAQADFKQGAELEMSSEDRVYPVSDSLQRVQGKTRLLIERQRQLARLAARTRTDRVEQTRYDERKRAEQRVLRDGGPAAESRRPATPPAAAAASDPFADADPVQPEKAPPKPAPSVAVPVPSTADPAKPGVAKPAAKPAPAEADPFAVPAGKPALDDPFGLPPAAPAAKPALDDPFGLPPAAPAAKPALDDPFGPPPPAKKDDAAGNPFGDDPPAAKPADAGNPFNE